MLMFSLPRSHVISGYSPIYASFYLRSEIVSIVSKISMNNGVPYGLVM